MLTAGELQPDSSSLPKIKKQIRHDISELLHSVSFDDLTPTLKEVYGVETDIYAYREAFDELNLHPAVRGADQMRSI